MDSHLDTSTVFVSADFELHLTLIRATQNSLIPKLLDSIIDLLTEKRKSTCYVDPSPQRGQQHHIKSLDAVFRRDASTAPRNMKKHLQQIREDGEKLARCNRSGHVAAGVSTILL
jgi:GntR family transcriptional regulator, transcriptional repressor for pyruvate dehydrogenase complex